MFVVAKYIVLINQKAKKSRSILTNGFLELQEDIIFHIDSFLRYTLNEDSITLYFNNRTLTVNNKELIPGCFQKYSRKQKTYYMDSSILVPGLINAHTHSFESLFQGCYSFNKIKDIPFKNHNMLDWLLHPRKGLLPLTLFANKQKSILNELIQDDIWHLSYQKNMYDQISSGITYCRDHIWNFGGILEASLIENIKIGMDHIVAIDCSPSINNTFLKAQKIIDNCAFDGIEFEVSGTDNDLMGNIKELSELGRHNDIGIHLHFCETSYQRNLYPKNSPVYYLYKNGVLGPKTSLAHCVHVKQEEYHILSELNTTVVVNDRSNGYLGSGKCNLIEMTNNGVKCCYGTDGASSIGIRMLSLLKESILLERIVHQDPSVIDAYDALYLATYGAAECMGVESIMGSIEKGKKANFFISLLNQPIYDPVSALIFLSSEEDIMSVCINGIERKTNQKINSINKDDMNRKLNIFSSYIKAKIGDSNE